MSSGADCPLLGGTIDCEAYDPHTNRWTYVDSMNMPRYQHTTTLLTNGKVLVIGGTCGDTTAEIYDPVNDNWTLASSISSPRQRHTATLLKDGRVLVVGGLIPGGVSTATCTIYDPGFNTWSPAASMSVSRQWHTATLLPDGTVMVDGGMPTASSIPRTEIFDPGIAPGPGTWTTVSPDLVARVGHGATLLPSGKVLVVGGANPDTGGNQVTCSLYDYANDTWDPTGDLTYRRDQISLVLLPNGNVMALGGDDGIGGSGFINSCEIYDPDPVTGIGTWLPAPSLSIAGNQRTTVLLADGRILDAVGNNPAPVTEIFDYTVGSWNSSGDLIESRTDYTLTPLANGKLLIAGGAPSVPISGMPLSTCELYDTVTNSWSPTDSFTARSYHAAVLLPDGKVLVAGGTVSGLTAIAGVPTNSCELYDPDLGIWVPTGSLNFARSSPELTLLFDGKVLLGGGGLSILPAEIYDPATQQWTLAATPAYVYFQHTQTLLPNGQVLFAKAGQCELFDPCNITFTITDALPNAPSCGEFRAQSHLLNNGQVLYFGGAASITGGATTAYLYDYNNPTWIPTGNMNIGRTAFGSILLPNGKVAAFGSYSGGTLTGAVEVCDPISGTWTTQTSMVDARIRTKVALLPNGKVLLPGGNNTGNTLQSTEIYDPGLGYNAADIPIITSISPSSISVPASTAGFTALTITGTGFQDNNNRGGGEGSVGCERNSATNYPIVEISRIGGNGYDTDFYRYLPFDVAVGNSWDSISTVVRFPHGIPNQLPAGVYAVKIIANGIPSKPAYLNVEVNCNVSAEFTATAVCLGDSTSFTHLPSVTPSSCWLYDFADGDTSFTQHPVHLYDSAGTYAVTMIAHSVMGCADTIIQTVDVNALPTVSAIASAATIGCGPMTPCGPGVSMCENDSLTLAGSGALTYSWDNGVTDAIPFIQSVGTVTYTLLATDSNGCENTSEVEVTVTPLGSSMNNDTICQGDSIYLEGAYQSTAGTYVDTIPGTLLFFPGGGSVWICDSIVTTVLTVNTLGTSTNSTSICAGDSIYLNGAYQTIPGTYPDTIFGGSSNGCDSIAETALTVVPVSDPSYSYSSVAECQNGTDISATITGTAGGFSATPGGLSIDPVTGSIDVSASTAGTYDVKYTTTGACPTDSTISITITADDDATILSDSVFCENDPATNLLAASSGGLWSGTGITNASVGTFDPGLASSGDHLVTYGIDGFCGDTVSATIRVN